MRAEGWGSLGSSLQALARGDPGNSKGWSLTPKYPTPKLQFTHDLDGEGVVGGGILQGAEEKGGYSRCLQLLRLEGGAHNMAGRKKAEGRSEREE